MRLKELNAHLGEPSVLLGEPLVLGLRRVEPLGHFGDAGLFVPYLATLTASGAIAFSRMAKARGWPTIPLGLSGAITPLVPVMTYETSLPFLSIALATVCGVIAFLALTNTHLAGRRLVASLLAGAVAWATV